MCVKKCMELAEPAFAACSPHDLSGFPCPVSFGPFAFRREMGAGKQVLGVVLKSLLGWPAPCIRVPGLESIPPLPIPALCYCAPWEAARDAQVVDSLSPPWETGIELLGDDFGLAQPWMLQAFGE